MVKAGLKRHRNVLKRDERIAILQKDGKLKDTDSIYGLAKTKVSFKVKKSKAKAEKKEGEDKKA